MIKASAPGKCIIIGEHAVVYGHPAIIAAIGKRIYVEAEKSDKVTLRDNRFNSYREWSIAECKEAAQHSKQLWEQCKEKGNFSEMLAWGKDNGTYNTYWKTLLGIVLNMVEADSGLSVHITKCEIPTGSGLGSSSSAAVAIAKAANEIYKRNFDLEKINEIAYECEKLMHGTPSGGDNSACCFGGLIWFKKMQPKNEIKPLREEIPHKLENFVLVYTGQPEKTTGELVQMVRDLEEEYRNKHIRAIGKMVPDMLDAMKAKNYVKIRDIINRTWDNLNALGLSTPNIDKIVAAVRKIGGAAKACGACGGGIVLCQHDNKQRLIETIKQAGFEPIEADLAVEGVRVEG